MKDRPFWMYEVAGGVTGGVIGVAVLMLVACASAGKGGKIASPDVKIPIASTTGDAEGLMGPVYAGPGSPVTQTTIGTISLGSGYLWAPVALLVGVALQRDRKARWRGMGLRRVATTLKYGPSILSRPGPGGLHPSAAKMCCDALERNIEANNQPPGPWSPWYWGRKDGPEREIAAAVKRLKKRSGPPRPRPQARPRNTEAGSGEDETKGKT